MAKLNAKQRNELPDSMFGIPEDRSYPMPDAKHVKSAIAFFHKAPESKKKELAKNINRRAKELNVKIVGNCQFMRYISPDVASYNPELPNAIVVKDATNIGVLSPIVGGVDQQMVYQDQTSGKEDPDNEEATKDMQQILQNLGFISIKEGYNAPLEDVATAKKMNWQITPGMWSNADNMDKMRHTTFGINTEWGSCTVPFIINKIIERGELQEMMSYFCNCYNFQEHPFKAEKSVFMQNLRSSIIDICQQHLTVEEKSSRIVACIPKGMTKDNLLYLFATIYQLDKKVFALVYGDFFKKKVESPFADWASAISSLPMDPFIVPHEPIVSRTNSKLFPESIMNELDRFSVECNEALAFLIPLKYKENFKSPYPNSYLILQTRINSDSYDWMVGNADPVQIKGFYFSNPDGVKSPITYLIDDNGFIYNAFQVTIVNKDDHRVVYEYRVIGQYIGKFILPDKVDYTLDGYNQYGFNYRTLYKRKPDMTLYKYEQPSGASVTEGSLHLGRKLKIKYKELLRNISMNEKGEIKINLRNQLTFEHYEEVHNIIKQNNANHNYEAMKENLAYIFTLILMIEEGYMNENKGHGKKPISHDKEYDEMIRLRALLISDFKLYTRELLKHEPRFDFLKYYKNSKENKDVVTITPEMIKKTGMVFRAAMLG